MIYLHCGEERDLGYHTKSGMSHFRLWSMSPPTPRVLLPYKKGAECNIDSSELLSFPPLHSFFYYSASLTFFLSTSYRLLMQYSARFPSFTTVILSARESFPYSDYYRCTKHENCSPSFQTPLKTETDLMKTIDLRDIPLRHSGYFLPEYIIDDDEETEASDEDNDDRFRREKGIAHGLNNAITKTKILIPRFLLPLLWRLGIRKERPVQVVARKHDIDLTR
ncbi:hypothetical protein M378DRAFT_160125 [Amanita muscaria Koide BX008]|uniref:Uncharacterized protein n=1 Tax=Amanita muscaria (strain Koide BX008) TaxID=946122 RepID=A0A0C2XE89_AMAMK|nr:hypothetical protein M378DRAFT_160125 [Amanita muscaria Koide BX008]